MNKKTYSFILFLLILSNNVFALTGGKGKLPTSLNELIDSSEVIVVGKKGKIIDEGFFYGYQENAKTLERLDKLTRIPLGVYFVDYQIEIDELVKKCKKKRCKKSNKMSEESTVIYRELSTHRRNSNSNSNKKIFFLTHTPDGTYSAKTTIHKLNLNESNPASYMLGGKEYTVDASDERFSSSSNDLVQQIKEIVNSSNEE